MLLTRRILLATALLAIAAHSFAQTPPKREFRAAWVATVTNLDWPSSPGGNGDTQKAALITLIDRLKSNGVSAIVFQVRPECDALYQSTLEPWSYWLSGSQGSPPSPFFDPLQVAIDACHERGMELHAWFNPYRAERTVGNYQTAASHVTKAHPDWVLQIGTLKFLDPGLPQVRDHVARVLSDVMRRYDVDGIHMDDYFYPYPPNHITNQDAATFAAYPRGFTNIGDWRRDNINLLLRMIRDSLQAIGPHVKFGMSPFGIWKNGVPFGISGLDAYSTIYCDAITWLRDGSIDYLTPQLYWQIGGSQDYSKLSAWWADSASFYGRHLYPGMAAYRIVGWTASEMPNQVRINRANPKIEGEVFFRANAGINDNPKGFADSLRNDFYKYLALHPVMAWKDNVKPNVPRAIRYEYSAAAGRTALQWDLPLTASDGDSASRYAVYRFDHYPSLSEFADPRNVISIEGRRFAAPAPAGGLMGPFYYAVTALDRNYNESDTSNILVLGAPAAPVLATPANGATSLPETTMVVWRSAALGSTYRLQLGTDSTFAAGILIDAAGIADTFKVVGGLVGQATHYWRVSATGAGGTGPFSAPFSFTTGFPLAPVLASPANFATEIDTIPSLRWFTSPAATSYALQVSRSSTFSPLVYETAGITDTTSSVGPLLPYTIYFWRVKAANVVGPSGWSETFRFRTVQTTEILADAGVPGEYELSQNYPNPFNPVTTIRVAVPSAARVTLKIYDMLGREVATLLDGDLPPGYHVVQWDAHDVASGMYIYRMTAGGTVQTRSMILLR